MPRQSGTVCLRACAASCAVLFAATLCRSSLADQLAVTPLSPGGWGQAWPYDWGYSFQVSQPITVTGLAYYRLVGDLDFQPHLVGIWDVSAPAAPLVLAGVGGGSRFIMLDDPHGMAVTDVAPVVLMPDKTYVVSGTAGVGDAMYQAPNFLSGPEVHVLDGRWGYNEGGYASQSAGVVTLGGNFLYTTAVCAGSADINCDGSVDGTDLGSLLGSWGECPGCACDLNTDGIVDGTDLGILLGEWNS